MRTISHVLTVGAALVGAGVALAIPASADPAPGNYTGTILQSDDFEVGDDAPFTMNTCGPDCIHVVQTEDGWQLHRQGAVWTETDADGTVTLDEGTLHLTLDESSGAHTVIGLVKNA
jgi:hypothetical protein